MESGCVNSISHNIIQLLRVDSLLEECEGKFLKLLSLCWKDAVEFCSWGSVTDLLSSGELQMARESAIDCLTVCGMDYTDISFLCYHGSVRKNKGMRGNTEIDVVIRRRIRTCYLCFTHVPGFCR